MDQVTVVIPAYNAARHIQDAIRSACMQSHRNLDIVVVDDGSTDDTADLVRAEAVRDARVRLVRQANQGVAAARNRGIDEAHGAFIAPLDADDIWYPRKLERQIEALRKAGPEVGLVYSGWELIDVQGRSLAGHITLPTAEGDVADLLIERNVMACASTPLIRRACFAKVGGYTTAMREAGCQGCEDWDFYLRIAEQYHFALVPECLLGYRRAEGSMSSVCNTMKDSYEIMLSRLLKRRPEVPKHRIRKSRRRFFLYLTGICSRNGDRAGTLKWLVRAVTADPANVIAHPPSLTAYLNISRILAGRAR